MLYSTDHLRTAGKITVYTALLGLVVFIFVFMFNVGGSEIKQVIAQQNASTSVIVLNTPPLWTASTTELIESSSDNPTNEGDQVTWRAIATDSNSEDYFLLICEQSASPATSSGGNPPSCSSGTQWAVSAAASSGVAVEVSTTTLASTSPFAGEIFNWYAWICDANTSEQVCNTSFTQGTNATNSSPFEVNHRPVFTDFWDTSPGDPGQLIIFTSTSSDEDISGTADTVRLVVCATAGFSTTTDTCTGTELGSTTIGVSADATTTYTIDIPTQDGNMQAWGYVIDNHGLEASGGSHGTDAVLTVSNVAPTVLAGQISLAQVGATNTDMYLTVESGETTGFTLSFVSDDNNSCDVIGQSGQGNEMTGYELSIYRNGPSAVPTPSSSSTCPVDGGAYDANNCYPTDYAPWNISCTASSTTCTDSNDTDILWECTFPLWYIADPTDGIASTTQYFDNDWRAQVRAVDDDGATGTVSESTSGQNVASFLAFALNTLNISYGSLEPGQQNDPLAATSTIFATGNVGLDKDVEGSDMCSSYTGATPCNPSATSTIPAAEQRFGTTTVSYANGTQLSSTTPQVVQINVPKSTATSSQEASDAYWGIRVPGTITFAGAYTGENTFTALVSNSSEW